MAATTPISPSTVRADLDDLGHRARKRFGQHFLADGNIVRKILDSAEVDEQPAVEIGPGLGALTGGLVERARRLWLIEVDRDLATRARATYEGVDTVQVVESDVLEVDFDTLLSADRPAVLVANLPYNVATPILERLVERHDLFSRMMVMVQLEVAQRMVARPGGKTYGVLSIMTQMAADATLCFRVPRTVFVPRPKVESAVVRLVPRAQPPVDVGDRARFAQVVKAAFGQRRKHLSNSLRKLFDDPVASLEAAGIDAKRRPETLSLDEFARLANAPS